jgi:plasmid stabilization system protein ParE
MYVPIIHPLARQDIGNAAKWYNERQAGLGKRFTQHVQQKVRFITQNPYAVAVRYDETRTAVLDVFPYMIHFSIDNDKKQLIISAVLSTHRDPETWKGK